MSIRTLILLALFAGAASADAKAEYGELLAARKAKRYDRALELGVVVCRIRAGRGALPGPAARPRRLQDGRRGGPAFAVLKKKQEKEWLEGTGGAALLAWLRSHPQHILAPNARYRLGKAQVRSGRGPPAGR